ncbi:MAG TPA: GNAT family protein [Segetibacter sp.]|jgi:ribosomal-protein-alanine N-acetyltransferase
MLNLNFDPFPELITERLVSRQIRPADRNEIFFLRSDERVMKYFDKQPAQSVEEAVQFLDKITSLQQNNECITWAITLKGQPTLIGTICFWNIAKEHYRAEIGYALHPDHSGKGIMQDAMTEVLKYGFKNMKLHSVEAKVNPHNISSIKILERNNFKREGYFKEDYFFDGKFLDTAVYSLLTTLAD